MKPGIRQISEITGFSPATVSNALNNKKGVSRETAEQILKVARECGYLSGQKITAIRFVIFKDSGLVVSDTPFFSDLIAGVENEARQMGFETLLMNLDRSAPSFDGLLQQILSDGNSAILLLGTELSREDALLFEEASAPVVLLDSWIPGVELDAVLINNTDSACSAVEYLLDRGHTQIGYLHSSVRIRNFFYREMGFHRALAARKIEADPAFMFSLPPTMDGSREQMNKYLAKNPPLPSAFFADNDIIALGAMKALQEHGVRIPEDVSIIGFDDLPFCGIATPGLTTIRVFKQEMGQLAVRRLREVMEDGGRVRTKTQVCTEFVERGSVRCMKDAGT